MQGDLPPSSRVTFFDVAGGRSHDFAAGEGAAGEGDFVHEQAGGERVARGVTRAEEELRGTRREAGFGDELEQLDGRERGGLGGFEDAAVSRGQTRREFPRGHEQRVIPRDDLPAHADGFAHDHPLDRRVADLVGLPERFRDQPGVVAEARGRVGHIVFGLAQWLAVVARFEFGESGGVLVDEVGEFEKMRRPLRCAHLRPRAFVESAARVGDGEPGFVFGAVGDHRDDLVVRGVGDLACCAVGGPGPSAVEKHRESVHRMTFRPNPRSSAAGSNRVPGTVSATLAGAGRRGDQPRSLRQDSFLL